MPQTKQIGSLTFQITQLPAWENFRAFHAFLKLVGPSAEPVLKIATRLALGKGNKPASVELAPVILDLVTSLPQTLAMSNIEDLEAFARTMFKTVIVVGAGGEGATQKAVPLLDVFDSMMTGKLMVVMEVLWACVQENFGGFFEDLLKRGAAFRPAVPSPKVAPSASGSPTT